MQVEGGFIVDPAGKAMWVGKGNWVIYRVKNGRELYWTGLENTKGKATTVKPRKAVSFEQADTAREVATSERMFTWKVGHRGPR